MRRLPFVRHLPVGKLRYRYTSCRHPVEKPRWHALGLLARTDCPRTPAAVADVVGRSAVTVRRVLHRWNDHGPDGGATAGPETGPTPNCPPAGRPNCTPPSRPIRRAAGCGPGRRWPGTSGAGGASRSSPRPGGGGGSGSGSPSGCLAPATPRPPHPSRNGSGLDRLATTAADLRAANPDKAVEVWAEDEARLGASRSPAGSGRPAVVARGPAGRRSPSPCTCSGSRTLRPAGPAPGSNRRRTPARWGRPGRLRRVGRSRRAEGACGDRRQRRVARGREAGGVVERGPPPPAGVYPGVAAVRAAMAAGPGSGGERDLRSAGRPPAGHPAVVSPPGRGPGRSPGGRRVPLGRPAGTVNLQCKTV